MDERGRLWAALELCDPPQRLALVLRDFNQLDDEQVCRLVHWTAPELRERLPAARRRLGDAAGASTEQAARTALRSLSLGAPRLDLWPRLAQPARLFAQRARRRRRIVLGCVAGLLALLSLAGGLWLAGRLNSDEDEEDRVASLPTVPAAGAATVTSVPALTPTPPLVRPAADVPDTYLVSYDRVTSAEEIAESITLLFDPARDIASSLHSGSVQAISPDGRWLVYGRSEAQSETNRRFFFSVLDAASGAVTWEREVEPFAGRIAVVGERIYGVHFSANGSDPPTLTAYRLADGVDAGTVEFDVGNVIDPIWWRIHGGVGLFATPDGAALRLVFVQADESGLSGTRVVLTYRAADLMLESVVSQPLLQNPDGSSSFGIDFYSARLTPDGGAAYGLDFTPTEPELRFLDFESAAVTAIALPFTIQPQSPADANAPMTPVPSHDGRWLYLIGRSGEVAVLDLLERRLARRFPLDLNGHTLPAAPEQVWNSRWGAGLLSHDGRRIYLFHSRAANLNDPTSPVLSTGVWVIDVERWVVAESWQLPAIVLPVALSLDGSELFCVTYSSPEYAPPRRELYALDTMTGQLRPSNADFQVPATTADSTVRVLEALRQEYSSFYGFSPASGEVAPADLATYSTLPLVELAVPGATLPAGSQVSFEIRFHDPASGLPLTAATRQVRYDPAAGVTLTLSHAEQGDIIVVPLELSEGVFQAVQRLDATGDWDAVVSVRQADGTGWSQAWPEAVEITPSFLGSDGRRYIFQLSSSPAQAAVAQEIAVRVTLVDAATLAALPEWVEIEGGLPERIEVSFLNLQIESFRRVTLEEAVHGVYEGLGVFQWEGRWQATLSFRVPGVEGPPFNVQAGELEIVTNQP